MAIDTYKVYVYSCDHKECEASELVEDRGGASGSQPVGIFTGNIAYNDEKGFQRVHWVACSREHINGAQENAMDKKAGESS